MKITSEDEIDQEEESKQQVYEIGGQGANSTIQENTGDDLAFDNDRRNSNRGMTIMFENGSGGTTAKKS